MTMTSGPSKERLIRLGIFSGLAVVGCVLFLLDGFYRYPNKNALQARDEFPDAVEEISPVNPRVTHQNFGRIIRLKESGNHFLEIEAVNEIFGEPSYDNGKVLFWVGPAGYVKAEHQAGRRYSVEWARVNFTYESLRMQKGLGVLAGLMAIPALVILFRVAGVKAVLDDKGLTLNQGETVAWDQMTELDTSRYKAKGWVVLRSDRQGQAGELKLDSYHLSRFRDIVAEICRRKGFPSPLDASVKRTPTESESPSAGA